ncbi:hypothetical protein FD733_14705 [Pantoea sp. Eser]|nr:hypothetical protein [Pantoea sp. Eser]
MLFALTGTAWAAFMSEQDDPTNVTNRAGVLWSDTYDMDDSNLSFSGSVALDKVKTLNARVNSDARA